MNITTKTERAIVTALVTELGLAGYVPVSVWDGGEYVPANDVAGVLDAVFAVDISTIHFAPRDKLENWGRTGVFIVCGNGVDCVSDYHDYQAGEHKAFSDAVKLACDKIESLTVSV